MNLLITLYTLLGVVFAENCDELGTWSVPTVSDGSCRQFQNGQYPSIDDWFCDWGTNSGFYYNYYRCHPFVSSPAYSSYISNMPSAMYSMMAHTTAVVNQCADYAVNLQASSWGDIPFMCPDLQSSYRHTIAYEGSTMSSLYESSCQYMQRIFCGAVWPSYVSSSWLTTPSSLYSSSSSYDMMARFLTYYTYNSVRLYDTPTVSYSNDLTPSFLEQFVSSLYSCQREIWSDLIKIDCSVITSMFNALGYPQNDWTPYVTNGWADSNDNCRTIIDHVYQGYMQRIHKSVEYVSYAATCGSSATPTHSYFTSSYFPSFVTSSYIPYGGGDDDDDDDEGLSEWVIVVLSAIGVIGVLGFCALLFFFIYKIYTFNAPPTEARYRVAEGDEVIMNIRDGNNAAKAPATPPPSYDNMKTTASSIEKE